MQGSTKKQLLLPVLVIAYLLGMLVIAFFLGQYLSLMGFMGIAIPYFLIGLPLVGLVPWACTQLIGRIVRKEKMPESLALLGLIVALTLGLRGSFVLRDIGFRALAGNRLQAAAVAWLETPEPVDPSTGLPERRPWDPGPPSLNSPWIPPPKYVTRGGTFPSDKHVTLGYGGGFGHWGLMIGSPEFQPEESRGSSHWLLFPGVYGFDSH
jgi:hypothetical protein